MGLLQDLRYALRLIVKERWFAAVAVVALSLGIGMNATVFTLVNAVLIRGLPFHDSGRLYMLSADRAQGGPAGVSYPDLQDWRAATRAFEGLAAFGFSDFNIADDSALPEQVRGNLLTSNAFKVLGQQPLLGRDFAPDEDQKGAERVVILGHTLWSNRYGADPNVIGRAIRVNAQPATIIGVMPPGMKFPTNADIWMPLVPTAEQERRSARGIGVFGRLGAGATRAAAQAEMN